MAFGKKSGPSDRLDLQGTQQNLAPEQIHLQQGSLSGVTRNRALPAYQANADAGAFGSSVNEAMVQLALTTPGDTGGHLSAGPAG